MKKINLKETGSGLKKSFRTKSVRFGSYSSALIAVVIAVAVAFNLVISQIPEKYMSFDLSPGKLYTIGEKTEKLLSSLEEDVTLTVLAEESSADRTLSKLLERYEDESKHVHVEYIDPAVNLEAAQKYSSVSQNSIVVSCGSKENVIDYNNIYVSDYSSYYTTGSYSTSFDGEGQITSAVANVTSDEIPAAYTLTGHGESTVGSSLSSLMTKQNISLQDLNLMTSGGIPEDCDCLIINAPSSDLGAEEADQIIKWLDEGGKAVITAGYTETELTNFNRVLAAYGMKINRGIVMESANHYYQYPLYVIPNIEDSEITSDLVSEKANILIPQTMSIEKTESEDVVVTDLLTSSDGAYAKTVVDGKITSYEKESGDTDGPFAFACLAQKNGADAGADESTDAATGEDSPAEGDSAADESGDTAGQEESAGGQMILISAGTITDESLSNSLPVANLDFYMNCLGSLSGGDDSAGNISIDAKSVDAEYLTIPAMHANIWLVVTVILLPLVILATGFVIWFGRRKK